MCVGVTASCMVCSSASARESYADPILQPSMSNLLHHLPDWEILSSQFSSRFSAHRSSNRGKSLGSEPSYSKREREEYSDLEASNPPFRQRDCGMAPIKSIRTYVHTGNPKEMEEDGIHLQYNVEQESTISEHGKGQTSKGLEREPRDTD